MQDKPVLGILLGDPAGVGPEIVAKLAVADFFSAYCRPLFIGDKRILDRAFSVIGKKVAVKVVSSADKAEWNGSIPMLDLADADPEVCPYGKLSVVGGKACLDELTMGVKLFQDKMIQGFCFVPLNKAGMKEAGCTYESEHHYMAHLFGCSDKPFGEINVVDNLWTTRTTSHIPIKEVSQNLTIEKIFRAITLADVSLKSSGIAHPRIGIAALNPHCGENGLCGREEIDVIAPAIQKAKDAGMDVYGPFPSDILFIKAFRGDFNGVVTMYHDQGQIALKLKGFDQGITIAGGLPAPIVTCAHGTAYDIAGKGIVKTSAFENAVKMASRMAVHLAEERS